MQPLASFGRALACPRILREFLVHLDLLRRSPLLDLACGTGNYARALAEADHAVTGLGLSHLMLPAARSRAPELRLVHADAK